MNIKALIKSLLLRKFNTALLLLQLAITLGLIVNSSILSLDTANKLAVDTGLKLDETLLVNVADTSGDYRDSDFARSIVAQDIAALSQIPGVKAVSISNQWPIQNGGTNGNVYDLDDPELYETDRALTYVQYMSTDENIFEAWGLELVEGRFLTQLDVAAPMQGQPDYSPNVVITESLSKTLHKGQSSLGQELNAGIVVGVVKDVLLNPNYTQDKQYGVFTHSIGYHVQHKAGYSLLVDPAQMDNVRKKVEDTILGVEAQRDIYNIRTMGEHFENYYANNKGLANLFIMLTLLMLLVTAISSFAYARFHMSQQTKFIGIRRALGAKKSDVIVYVLAENWLISGLAMIFGIGLMIGLNILLSQYVSISKPDVLLAVTGIATVFLAGTFATWWPAYQTSKIPPVIATRSI
jgi:putative ABC transport system permease protein